jgi:enolase
MKIKDLKIRKILNTKSQETIEIEAKTKKGIVKTSVPQGTSKGKYEAKYLPIKTVLKNFQKIKKYFINKEFRSQEEVDLLLRKLDKTRNFSKIGGNLALGISSVALKAFALDDEQQVYEYLGGKKLPKLLANVAGGWGKGNEIQEFLVMPVKQKSFSKNVFKIAELYIELGKILKSKDRNFRFSKNYESGWVTSLSTNKLLDIISDLVQGKNLTIGLDVAASDRWNGKKYIKRSPKQHFDFISELVDKYNLKFIEDPFHEDDFDSFAEFLSKHRKILVCGDDLLATNPKRLELALRKNSVNAVIVKPNQIGTITDTMEFVKKAKKNNVKTIMSHRSGTTDDTLFAHLAVGLECDFAKFGVSGERIVKLNELIRIEEKLM